MSQELKKRSSIFVKNCSTIMSQSPSKKPRTSEDKDEKQETNLETPEDLFTSPEKGEMPEDEWKNLSCYLGKKLYPSDFRNWPILSLLKPEFSMQIRMVLVYGNGNCALIVTKDKNVYNFGSSNCDYYETSSTHIGLHPIKIEGLCGKNIKTLQRTSSFILALTEEGKVYSWGDVFNKRESDDKLHPSMVMSQVAGLSDKYIVDIACGSGHSLALTNDGKVYAWGKNDYGQIGIENSSTFDGSLPRQVKHELEGQKIVHIACGSAFNIVTTDMGKLYCWGDNGYCQISMDTDTSFFVHPCESISFLAEKVIVKVSCGFFHILALTDDGRIYTWGRNDKGQTGVENNPPTMLSSPPTMVDMPELVKDIAAGGDLSVALSNNNIVYVWGDCFGWCMQEPFPTQFSRIDDAFAYSGSRVMYKPLIVSTNDYYYFEEVLNILNFLKAGFDDPVTSDFIIQVEGKCIHVHKGFLQIRCRHFKDELKHNWFGNLEELIYTVSDKFSYIVYKAFLKYIYTGTVDLPSSENAFDLLKLADECGEMCLKRKCSRIIEQSIVVSNVALYYSKAIECNATEIEKLCVQFAVRHMKDVIETNNYKILDQGTQLKLLFTSVKNYNFQT